MSCVKSLNAETLGEAMQIDLGRLARLPRAATKCGKAWLIAALALSTAGLSEPTLAQCTGTPDNTICTPGGNPYATGINVSTSSAPINVTLQPGVQVVIPPGSGVNNAVGLHTAGSPSTGGPATLTANDAAVTMDTTITNPSETSAMRIQAGGDAIIGTPTNPCPA
jgi:hypothetical protein